MWRNLHTTVKDSVKRNIPSTVYQHAGWNHGIKPNMPHNDDRILETWQLIEYESFSSYKLQQTWDQTAYHESEENRIRRTRTRRVNAKKATNISGHRVENSKM